MLFTDFNFVVLVLATMLAFYLPGLRRLQTVVLIVASFVFFQINGIHAAKTSGDERHRYYLLLLLASITVNALSSYAVFHSHSLTRARVLATMGVIANVAVLCFFKYMGMIASFLPGHLTVEGGPAHALLHIALPVGISFFTFEGISLLVDTFKARDEPTFFGTDRADRGGRHLLSTTLFVSFFPHLVAGPILKAHDFFPQIKAKFFRDIDWEFCFAKLTVGYFLKMVVADNLAGHTFWIQYPYFVSFPSAELAALLFGYSMQIFADFAGYSLIAIGVAGLFGYRLPENFDFPYISQSFAEFWRRWHISLSSWLKEYLYFPLGGNRRGKVRTYANLFIVMFLGGLWHGAAWSYAIWGSVHGLALAIERALTPPASRGGALDRARASFWGPPLRMLMVFTVVTAAWLLFKLPDFSHAVAYVRALAGNWRLTPRMDRMYNVLILSLPVVLYHAAYLLGSAGLSASASRETFAHRWLRPLAMGAMLFLIAVNSGASGDFIYFQF